MEKRALTIDFETRSPVNLKDCGAWVYAEDPRTGVLCLAVKADEQPARLYSPMFEHIATQAGLPVIIKAEVCQMVEGAATIEAHNAEFERAIWGCIAAPRLGLPAIPFEKWRCSAAKAAAHALPRSLADAGAALNLQVQKDPEGKRLINRLCVPRAPRKGESPNLTYYHEDEESLVKLFRYCLRDVETEHELSQTLPNLSAKELEVWRLDQRINSRGIMADVDSALGVIRCIRDHEEALLREVETISFGALKSVKQVAALASICGIPDAKAATVTEALQGGGLGDTERRLLEIRRSLAQSSTAKYKKILSRICEDGRIRGEFRYHGASTGRWTGQGVQLQNLPRTGIDPGLIEIAFGLFRSRDLTWIQNLFGDPISLAKALIRPTFRASLGKVFISADFSQIEARTLLWFADEQEGLQLFRNKQDIYCDMASVIYGRPINKADHKIERQVGKTAILGLGFGMGGPKFQITCRVNAGVEIEKRLSRKSVKAYRSRFPGVPAFWYSTERAAIATVKTGDSTVNARTGWRMRGRFLQCVLPSGRALSYADPQVTVMPAWIYPALDLEEEEKETSIMILAPDRKTADTLAKRRATNEDLAITGAPIEREKEILSHMAVVERGWARETTYGGKLVENIVQGTARDIMAAGMLAVEAAGYPVVMTVHDEVVSEIPEGCGSLAEFEGLLTQPPAWAEGCPIAAEGWIGKRYRK